MSDIFVCPQCQSPYGYEDRNEIVCPECGNTWEKGEEQEKLEDTLQVFDAHGAILQDGDAVILIKDLKVKGSSSVLKQGTKVKSIRLIEGDHNIDCKIDGFGGMKLKSEFVKKS